MNRFFGFVKKEFQHIFRDVRTLVILFGLPIVMIVLFGSVVTTEIKNVKVGIWDRSRDQVTIQATQKIFSSGYFIPAGTISHEDEIGAMFRSGKAKVVVVFEADFERNLQRDKRAAIRLITDASDANSAQLSQNYLQGVLMTYFLSLSPDIQMPWEVELKSRMFYNETMRGVYMFVPGLMAMILMLISALMTSVTITREKEFGTMELLLASPLKPREIILGKVTPYILLAFVNALTIILLGFFVFDVPVVGSIWLLLAECLLYITMALSVGVLISTVATTQFQAFQMTFMTFLPQMLLSGFMFPFEGMPRPAQWLAELFPLTHFLRIVRGVVLKDANLIHMWQDVWPLLLVFTVLLLLSTKRFQKRLD